MGLLAPARAAALATLLVVVSACGMTTSNSESCDPGDFISGPRLADGGPGFLECLGDGSAYVAYSGPNPNDVPDADLGDAEAACSTAGGAKLGFMCVGCATSADCGSGLVCFDFPNKGGNLCTRTCTTANATMVCGPPSEGCGNNGHCKP